MQTSWHFDISDSIYRGPEYAWQWRNCTITRHKRNQSTSIRFRGQIGGFTRPQFSWIFQTDESYATINCVYRSPSRFWQCDSHMYFYHNYLAVGWEPGRRNDCYSVSHTPTDFSRAIAGRTTGLLGCWDVVPWPHRQYQLPSLSWQANVWQSIRGLWLELPRQSTKLLRDYSESDEYANNGQIFCNRFPCRNADEDAFRRGHISRIVLFLQPLERTGLRCGC